MNQQPIEIKCDKCAIIFEATQHRARKGELHATYLQCPVCYEIYPSLITDRALRRLMRDSTKYAFHEYKRRRADRLKKRHGESLKQMDGWTEERRS